MKHIQEYADNGEAQNPLGRLYWALKKPQRRDRRTDGARSSESEVYAPLWDTATPGLPTITLRRSFQAETWSPYAIAVYRNAEVAEGNFERTGGNRFSFESFGRPLAPSFLAKSLWHRGFATADSRGMDRAALEACVGGAFYPGIEAGWVMRNPDNIWRRNPFAWIMGSFRRATYRTYACPWQADFYECNTLLACSTS